MNDEDERGRGKAPPDGHVASQRKARPEALGEAANEMDRAMAAAQETRWLDLQATLVSSQDALTSIWKGVILGEPAAANSVPSTSDNAVDAAASVVQCALATAKAVANLVDR